MFGRKKNMTHEQKVEYAYHTYRDEVVTALFPEGVTEAGNVIDDLARICGVRLENCSASQYEDVLNMYTETVAGKVVSGAAEDAILRTLKKKYGKYASGHENDIYAYSMKHMDDRNTGRDLPETKAAAKETPAVAEPEMPAIGDEAAVAEPEMPAIGDAAAVAEPEMPAIGDEAAVVEPEMPAIGDAAAVAEPETPAIGDEAAVAEPEMPAIGDAAEAAPEAPAVAEPETPAIGDEAETESVDYFEASPLPETDPEKPETDTGRIDPDEIKAIYRKTLKKFDLKADKEDPVLLLMLENKKDFVKKTLKHYGETAEAGVGTVYWAAAYAAAAYKKDDSAFDHAEKGVFSQIRKDTDMDHMDAAASEMLKDKKGKLRKPLSFFLEKLNPEWEQLDEKTRKQVLKYAFLLGSQAGLRKA